MSITTSRHCCDSHCSQSYHSRPPLSRQVPLSLPLPNLSFILWLVAAKWKSGGLTFQLVVASFQVYSRNLSLPGLTMPSPTWPPFLRMQQVHHTGLSCFLRLCSRSLKPPCSPLTGLPPFQRDLLIPDWGGRKRPFCSPDGGLNGDPKNIYPYSNPERIWSCQHWNVGSIVVSIWSGPQQDAVAEGGIFYKMGPHEGL